MVNATVIVGGQYIHSRGYHAGLKGQPEAENPFAPGKPEFCLPAALLWKYGWELGNSEKK